jgi:hypothetical protein
MKPKHFIYQLKNPNTGELAGHLGMITILKKDEMGRVPEWATEVSGQPVADDPNGTYFKAWELKEDGTVGVNIKKAIEVRMEFLRKRRGQMFEHLDMRQFHFYCRRDEEKIDEVEAEKQELRDFPTKIDWDVISTLHDVQHILPPILI